MGKMEIIKSLPPKTNGVLSKKLKVEELNAIKNYSCFSDASDSSAGCNQ
jgi:hypothetical protein